MSITQTLKDAIDLAEILANAKQKSELLGLLLNAREESIRLQDENEKLKKEIKSHDQFDERKEEYELVTTNNCVVYQHKTDSYYVCQHCVEKYRKFYSLIRKGIYPHCPCCKTSFPV